MCLCLCVSFCVCVCLCVFVYICIHVYLYMLWCLPVGEVPLCRQGPKDGFLRSLPTQYRNGSFPLFFPSTLFISTWLCPPRDPGQSQMEGSSSGWVWWGMWRGGKCLGYLWMGQELHESQFTWDGLIAQGSCVWPSRQRGIVKVGKPSSTGHGVP